MFDVIESFGIYLIVKGCRRRFRSGTTAHRQHSARIHNRPSGQQLPIARRLAASPDEQGDGDVMARGGGADEGVEDLVITEH
jgi:hypothetical protein